MVLVVEYKDATIRGHENSISPSVRFALRTTIGHEITRNHRDYWRKRWKSTERFPRKSNYKRSYNRDFHKCCYIFLPLLFLFPSLEKNNISIFKVWSENPPSFIHHVRDTYSLNENATIHLQKIRKLYP